MRLPQQLRQLRHWPRAVDWIERIIPIAETRNYVQRVMENLQVYSAGLATIEPNLHRATHVEWRPKPTFVDAIPQ